MSIIKNKSNSLLVLGLTVLLSGTLNASAKVDNNTTATTEQKGPFKKVVATVNGENIYENELDKLVKKKLRSDSVLKSSGTNSGQENVLRHTVLNELIEKKILKQASLKEPLSDIDRKIKLEIELIKEKFGSIEKYKSYLQNMSDEEFNTLLKNKIQMQEYLKKEGVVNPDIPEEEIKKFYGVGKSFTVQELIKASQILLLFGPSASENEKNNIKKEAEKLRELIVNGADFRKLVKEHSQSGEANATIPGDLGIVKKGYMPKEFDEVAFAMKKGELSKVFASKFGYHIVKVTDRREAGVTPYEDVKDFIRKFLQEKKTVKMLDALKKRVKSEAKVEIMLNKK